MQHRKGTRSSNSQQSDPEDKFFEELASHCQQDRITPKPWARLFGACPAEHLPKYLLANPHLVEDLCSQTNVEITLLIEDFLRALFLSVSDDPEQLLLFLPLADFASQNLPVRIASQHAVNLALRKVLDRLTGELSVPQSQVLGRKSGSFRAFNLLERFCGSASKFGILTPSSVATTVSTLAAEAAFPTAVLFIILWTIVTKREGGSLLATVELIAQKSAFQVALHTCVTHLTELHHSVALKELEKATTIRCHAPRAAWLGASQVSVTPRIPNSPQFGYSPSISQSFCDSPSCHYQ